MTAVSLRRTAGLARWNAVLLARNRLAVLYGVALPLAPLLLLLGDAPGAGAAAVVTTLTMAALFPVFYNVLSQFVNRRDELVLKRLRVGEARDLELLVSLALPGCALALAVALLAVPVAVALGEPAPLNPLVHVGTAVLTVVLFTALACWTAAWTRNAEAAQLTSMPVIVLVLVGQVSVAFPESAQRLVRWTPGAAMTELGAHRVVRLRGAGHRAHAGPRRHVGGSGAAGAGAVGLDRARRVAGGALAAVGTADLSPAPSRAARAGI